MKRLLFLLALAGPFGCTEDPPLPTCAPTHGTDAFGLCRLRCSGNDACLATEECVEQLCLPREDQGPVVTLFRATPESVASGEAITIDYVALFSDHVTITALQGDVADTVLDTSTTFAGTTSFGPVTGDLTLTVVATRRGQRDERTALVYLSGGGSVQIEAFSATPSRIVAGASALLDWRIAGGNGRFQLLEGAKVLTEDAAQRPFAVSPAETTTYTLVAEGDRGSVQAQAVLVVDAQPLPLEIVRFESLGTTPPGLGDNVVLSWQTTGAERLRLVEVDGAGAESVLVDTPDPLRAEEGRWIAVPGGARSYRLDVEGGGQLDARSLAFPAGPTQAPRLSGVTLSPEVIDDQRQALLVWTVAPEDARVTVAIDGQEIYDAPGSGSYTFAGGNDSIRFTVRAENPVGFDTAELVAFASELEAEPANDTADGAPSFGGRAIHGQLTPLAALDDVDWLSVRVREGQRVLASLLDCSGSQARYTLELRTSSDVVLETQTGPCPRLASGPLAEDQYFLRVTDPAPQSAGFGDYYLGVDVVAPICGNGVQEFGEECDDGARRYGDACRPDCTLDPSARLQVQSLGNIDLNPAGNSIPQAVFPRAAAVDARDQGVAVLSLPFDFPFLGRRHRGVFVHTDGYLSFLPGFSPTPLGMGAPNVVIAGFAADLELKTPPGLEGQISAFESIYGGTRVQVIDFQHLGFHSGLPGDLNLRVGLFEDGRIVLRYGVLSGDNHSVQAGIEDATGRWQLIIPGCEGDPEACPLSRLPASSWIEIGPAAGQGGG